MRPFATLLLVSLFALACFAQEKPTSQPPPARTMEEAKPQVDPRPTIGIALEGDGALGQAHIGVLKWFEEHHIPVDYVAGTSMGGLVGGFYATGKSADEIEDFIKNINWNRSLRNELPYRARS